MLTSERLEVIALPMGGHQGGSLDSGYSLLGASFFRGTPCWQA